MTTNNNNTEGPIRSRIPLKVRIVDMWAQGDSPKQIAEATGEPINLIYLLLKQKQTEITKEHGVINHEEKNET